MPISPHALRADLAGNIREDPKRLMLCNRAGNWFVPDAADLVPLPRESDLFLLPGRHAAGFNPQTGQIENLSRLAVAAFAAPGYTLSAHPAFFAANDAPPLPLFAYGAVGYAKGKFWICAQKVDNDRRQVFSGISQEKIEKNCRSLLRDFSRNRLVGHIINNCVRRYGCPAAKNFALGRYEAPLPTSRSCNARCVGCISAKQEGSPVTATPQCRLEFTPHWKEIVQVMRIHEKRERKTPIYSFGQGCEGDPLQNADLLAESIANFRRAGGTGTINCNSNASRPEAVAALADAGLTSLRVSLNSSRPKLYDAYYRPNGYTFANVCESIKIARQKGVFVSLNLLYFPGVTDTLEELETLAALCADKGVSMIQWRNLNIDPGFYSGFLASAGIENSPALGLTLFMESLHKKCPWLVYGYFNPWLGEKAVLVAPNAAT